MPKLDKSIITAHTDSDIAITVLNTVNSTNTYLAELQPQQITSCVAEQQTAGRGQLDKQWQSQAGNIFLSLAYPVAKTQDLTGLSLVAGLAVCAAVEQHCELKHSLQLKWPNDIMANAKKLAGILIETQPSADKKTAIIGVGLNIVPVSSNWISLTEISDSKIERNIIIADIINSLQQSIQDYINAGLQQFITRWNKIDYLRGKQIQLQSGQQLYSGTCQGIDDNARIVLRLESGADKAFASASIKLY